MTYQIYIAECPNCKTLNEITICTSYSSVFKNIVFPKNICQCCKKEIDISKCKIIKNKYPYVNYSIKKILENINNE